jgi:hypothetical protein
MVNEGVCDELRTLRHEISRMHALEAFAAEADKTLWLH